MRKALLLGVSLFLACGSNQAAGPPVGSSVPAELLGTWHYELLGDQLCEPSTGGCVPSYAHSETLQLTGDGRFSYVLYGESNFPPCSQVTTAEGRGTARVQGSSLLLSVQDGYSRKNDTCGERVDNDERGNTWAYTWELSGGELTLTNDQGTRIGPYLRRSGAQ